jgi:hypothetical protein
MPRPHQAPRRLLHGTPRRRPHPAAPHHTLLRPPLRPAPALLTWRCRPARCVSFLCPLRTLDPPAFSQHSAEARPHRPPPAPAPAPPGRAAAPGRRRRASPSRAAPRTPFRIAAPASARGARPRRAAGPCKRITAGGTQALAGPRRAGAARAPFLNSPTPPPPRHTHTPASDRAPGAAAPRTQTPACCNPTGRARPGARPIRPLPLCRRALAAARPGPRRVCLRTSPGPCAPRPAESAAGPLASPPPAPPPGTPRRGGRRCRGAQLDTMCGKTWTPAGRPHGGIPPAAQHSPPRPSALLLSCLAPPRPSPARRPARRRGRMPRVHGGRLCGGPNPPPACDLSPWMGDSSPKSCPRAESRRGLFAVPGTASGAAARPPRRPRCEAEPPLGRPPRCAARAAARPPLRGPAAAPSSPLAPLTLCAAAPSAGAGLAPSSCPCVPRHLHPQISYQ